MVFLIRSFDLSEPEAEAGLQQQAGSFPVQGNRAMQAGVGAGEANSFVHGWIVGEDGIAQFPSLGGSRTFQPWHSSLPDRQCCTWPRLYGGAFFAGTRRTVLRLQINQREESSTWLPSGADICAFPSFPVP